MNSSKVYKIRTTAYKEEDFYLLTDLSEQDIIEVIMPLVNADRDGYREYDNDILFAELKNRYPSKHIEMFVEIDEIIV